jgi:UDP-N-acetylmuramoyl-tripeptide--D-alanyl-D-alanine ligase
VRLAAFEVARLLGAEILSGEPELRLDGGVSIDSRTVSRGDLFFAIIGPRHDGHDFLAQALSRGAAGVVISSVAGTALGPGPLVLRVSDTTRALQDLARGVRERSSLRVVAITGSMGKTTTKEAAACAIGSSCRVLKSEGNLNNFYGLPLSLLRYEDEEVAVLEMGMSAPGEIARLTEISRPDVGVLTNVAEVHLEFFESVARIADAKGELFEGLGPDATAVVNADDPLVLDQARKFRGRRILFGLSGSCDLRASGIEATRDGLRFRAERGKDAFEVRSALRGRHNVYNLLAGLAAATALDVPLGDAAGALSRLAPARHRGERLDFGMGFVLVDETYNSSPRALSAALESLSEEKGALRRIAVVGDMLELGERSDALHRAIGRELADRKIDRVVGVGPLGGVIAEAAVASGIPVDAVSAVGSARDAGRLLAGELREGDVVLLKASRGIALDEAIVALRKALGVDEKAGRS